MDYAFRCLVVVVVVFMVSACLEEFEDGYQVGDITSELLKAGSEARDLHDAYCGESNPVIKKALIKSIQLKLPEYPDGGICDF